MKKLIDDNLMLLAGNDDLDVIVNKEERTVTITMKDAFGGFTVYDGEYDVAKLSTVLAGLQDSQQSEIFQLVAAAIENK